MNISTLESILKYANPKRSVMLKGWHGIGKTEWVCQQARKWGLKLVIWHASHAADAGDITGLPRAIKERVEWVDENGVTQVEEHEVTIMCPPKWMVQKEPVLLLLDEINRGLRVAMNALMQLTNSQTYDDIVLPTGSRIFACINPNEDGSYQVNNMDAAQLSRFDVYDFTPSPEEWIIWARGNGIHKMVIEFIGGHPRFLDPYTNEELVHSISGKDCQKLPDRRAWATAVSPFFTNGESEHAWDTPEGIGILTQGVAGMVGSGAADAFVDFVVNSRKALNPVKIINMERLNDAILAKVNELMSQDIVAGLGFIKSCTMYIEDNIQEVQIKSKQGRRWAENLYTLIDQLQPDCKVTAVSDIIYAAITEKKSWAKAVIAIKPEFKEMVRAARAPVLY